MNTYETWPIVCGSGWRDTYGEMGLFPQGLYRLDIDDIVYILTDYAGKNQVGMCVETGEAKQRSKGERQT
jgi:hypothetical protein